MVSEGINGKAVLRLPPLVARVDRVAAAVVGVHAVLVIAVLFVFVATRAGTGLLQELGLVLVALVILPIGITYHVRQADKVGAALVLGAMSASAILGVLQHFVLGGQTNVLAVRGQTTDTLSRVFELVAGAQALAALAGIVLALAALKRRSALLSILWLP